MSPRKGNIMAVCDACREKVQQLVQQRLAEQFRLMGDSLGVPAAGGITLEAAAAAHDVLSCTLDADLSDDEDMEDNLAHLTPESGILHPSFLPVALLRCAILIATSSAHRRGLDAKAPTSFGSDEGRHVMESVHAWLSPYTTPAEVHGSSSRL